MNFSAFLKIFFCIVCSSFSVIFSNELTDLANKYQSDKGNQIGDAHFYTEYYDALFSPYRKKPIHFLEIGLNLGDRKDCASLQMWLEYFPQAQLYGFDIVKQTFSHERAHIFQGDQSRRADLRNLAKKTGKLDIVLDDGSHIAFHQQLSFVLLFPYIKSGGLYIIEDLYYPGQTSSEEVNTTKEVMKKILQQKNVSTKGISSQEWENCIAEIQDIMFIPSAKYGQENCVIIRKK